MSAIPGLENNSTATWQTGQVTKETLGKDDFLSMMVAQLQNQDPLNPMDGTEFTAQLAQFTSLEQMYNVNGNLELIQLYQASLNNSQAVNFIGKDILATGNEVIYSGEGAVDLSFELAQDAQSVFITVYDEAGNYVCDIHGGSMEAGVQTLTWGGYDDDGKAVDAGTYTFEVMATDSEGEDIPVQSYITDTVTGVTFKGGITYLLTEHQEIPIGSVIKVMAQEDDV